MIDAFGFPNLVKVKEVDEIQPEVLVGRVEQSSGYGVKEPVQVKEEV